MIIFILLKNHNKFSFVSWVLLALCILKICTLLVFYVIYLHSFYFLLQLLHNNLPRGKLSLIFITAT